MGRGEGEGWGFCWLFDGLFFFFLNLQVFCKYCQMNICRVSLYRICNCEISLICCSCGFSVPLALLTEVKFSCLLRLLLGTEPSPIHHLSFRSLYCYRLPLTTCIQCACSVYIIICKYPKFYASHQTVQESDIIFLTLSFPN